MTALEILEAARALIADPEHWTQGASATDNTGAEYHPESEFASAWCAAGALTRVCGEGRVPLQVVGHLNTAARKLFPKLEGYGMFVQVNEGEVGDGNDHANILRVFDLAIASA